MDYHNYQYDFIDYVLNNSHLDEFMDKINR